MLNTINQQNLVLSSLQWNSLGALIILSVGVLISMLLASVHFGTDKWGKLPHLTFTCFTLLAAIAWTVKHWSHQSVDLFNGALVIDYFSSLFTVVLCSATILVLLSSFSYLQRTKIHYSEFYPIVMVSCLGMVLLVSANELLSIFVCLELMSLAVYVLVGLRRNSAFSNEAAVKYFVMGGAGAAIFLYGTAMVYGALNTTKLAQISLILSQNGTSVASNAILILGVCLIIVGFLFKAAVAPFHMWTPDVYQGAPSPITSFMATALKAAVFAAFIRVSIAFLGDHGVRLLGDLGISIHHIFWALALVTMLVGNFVALMQPTMKRLMAYSAIAHTGYLMVGILAGPTVGYSGVVLYLVAYIGMNIGAFSIFSMFNESVDGDFPIEALAGFGKRHPGTAAALSIFLFSLGGIPPTAGFVGKYFLFSGALEAGETLLVLLAVFTSAVSVFYYFRVLVIMYMKEPGSSPATLDRSRLAYIAIAICLFLTISYGIFPNQLVHTVQRAVVF